MKKITTVAASAAIVASFAAGNAMADENPFGMQELNSGYNVAMSEGTCGEGKCGEDKSKAKDGKCGGDKAKEAKCGGDKAKEAKCGGSK